MSSTETIQAEEAINILRCRNIVHKRPQTKRNAGRFKFKETQQRSDPTQPHSAFPT